MKRVLDATYVQGASSGLAEALRMPHIVDMHCHCYPPELIAKARWWPEGDSPMRIEHLLEIHEQNDIDFCVVTNTHHYIKGMSDSEALDNVKRWHEYAAEIQRTYPDRIVAFAFSFPGGGDPFNAEFERAIKEYGLKGCFFNSSHNGHYPDEDAGREFFQLAVALDVPVMIHAPHSSFGEDCMNMYRLISSVGRPMDESLAIARMIVRGVFEELPDLKMICAHVGGGICEILPRMDTAYSLGDNGNFLGSYEPLLIKKLPSEYAKLLYFDSASYSAPVIELGIKTVGIEHMVFGSDAPPLVQMLPRMRELIESIDISRAHKELIYSGNVTKLLRLAVGRLP
jgi:aminocarboxymuconate-semialdehyde decarboxylase